MKKDFQDIQKGALIDDILELIDYAEGVIETNEDGLGREYADVNVNWSDESVVRLRIKSALTKHRVHFMNDDKTIAKADKVFDLMNSDERKDVLCFVFGLMTNRMARRDVYSMISYLREIRRYRRAYEAEEAKAEKDDCRDFGLGIESEKADT